VGEEEDGDKDEADVSAVGEVMGADEDDVAEADTMVDEEDEEEESEDEADVVEVERCGQSHTSGFTRNCGGGSTTADIVVGGGEEKEGEVEDGRSERRGGRGSGMTFLVWASSMRNSRGGGCVKE
jgi:hypothetical protein